MQVLEDTMLILSILPTFLREVFGRYNFPREPEPDLIMEKEAQVEAFAEGGRIEGVMTAAYIFHSARICQVIEGCDNVIDLGCGPATQLAQLAKLYPRKSFLGVDFSETMLEKGKRYVHDLGLSNVKFLRDDITRLDKLSDDSFDAVISTMTLHHLPSQAHLRSCFQQIRRILRPEGALYLNDFGRLKSLKSVLFFAYMNRDHQPHIFSLDYERSLRASFLLKDFQGLTKEELPPQTQVYATFKVPLLILIKTKDHRITDPLRKSLKEMRNKLSPRYRQILDAIRFFVRLGGLTNDPFR